MIRVDCEEKRVKNFNTFYRFVIVLLSNAGTSVGRLNFHCSRHLCTHILYVNIVCWIYYKYGSHNLLSTKGVVQNKSCCSRPCLLTGAVALAPVIVKSQVPRPCRQVLDPDLYGYDARISPISTFPKSH